MDDPHRMVLITLWGAPVVAAIVLLATLRWAPMGKAVVAVSASVLAIVALATLAKVSFVSGRDNVLAACGIYAAYCLLALQTARLTSGLVARTAVILSWAPIVFGYFMGSIGALGVIFVVGDAVRPPQAQRWLGPHEVCVITVENGIGDTSYHLSVYRRWKGAPLQRRLARISALDVSPDAPLRCEGEDLARALGGAKA